MNRASSATGWVRNPLMKSPELDPSQASSYELGWTYNPLTGCENHTPEGLCLGGMFPCYAYKLANGRLKSRYLENQNWSGEYDYKKFTDPFHPRFWEERLQELVPSMGENNELILGKPKGIFVCDMSDLFGIGIPYEWTQKVMATIKLCPKHRFYLLTKQPQNLIKFSPFPDNCWVGVTVTNADMLFDAINHLDDIQCSVRYLSIEPMLASCHLVDLPAHLVSSVDWVITGACTGRKAELSLLAKRYPELTLMPYGKKWTLQPQISWVEEIVRACDKAGVKVFLKDNLKPLFPAVSKLVPCHDKLLMQKHPTLCEGCEAEYCNNCGVIWGLRQEMPSGY